MSLVTSPNEPQDESDNKSATDYQSGDNDNGHSNEDV